MSVISAKPETSARWFDRLGSAGPAVLYGLRTSAAVCLALFAAFWLEIDNPNWAGTSAGIVSQPSLGQSVRKGIFRLVGTFVGAAATVGLTATFPQDRVGFLLGMTLWTALCSYVSTLLRNFAAYAAMLAGYTMAIIASDAVATPDRVFEISVSRTSTISIGIVCATVVIAGTDFGRTRRALAAALVAIVRDIGAHLRAVLDDVAHVRDDPAPRRALIKRIAALDPMIDEVGGEAAELRFRRTALGAARNGLFEAVVGWRALVMHLGDPPARGSGVDARPVLGILEPTLRPPPPAGSPSPDWAARRHDAEVAVALLGRLEDRDVSSRILAEGSALAAHGFATAFNALALIEEPESARETREAWSFDVPDHWPALVNAIRVFVAVGASLLFWIATHWPAGLTAVTFTAVTVLLLSPQQEQGVKAAIGFGIGTVIAAAVAATVKFALLPNHETFLALALIITLVLTPLAAMATVPSLKGIFTGGAMNFIPLLGPTNEITYDTISFYAGALAIVGGCIFGALMMRLIPPVPAETRARRLASLALRDLRALASRRATLPTLARWNRRVHARLAALPAETDSLHGSRLMAALSVGRQVIRLRRQAGTWRERGDLDDAMEALARGDIGLMERKLAALDAGLAAAPRSERAGSGLGARASIQVMLDAMAHHTPYFEVAR